MAGETTITIIGNLTGDPELRFTPSGAAVANFTVASTPRTFDRQSNEWKDGDTLFMRCSVWREVAENVAETLHKGNRVLVTGRLRSRSYETKEGEKRTVIELDVDEIGPSLRYATAQITRTQRGGGGNFGAGGGGHEDPWAGPAGNSGGGQGNQGGWGAPPAHQGGGNQGGWGAPQQGGQANQGGGNQGGQGGGNQGGGNQGGWGSAPSYDEPPF